MSVLMRILITGVRKMREDILRQVLVEAKEEHLIALDDEWRARVCRDESFGSDYSEFLGAWWAYESVSGDA